MPTYFDDRITLSFDGAHVRVCLTDIVIADSARAVRLDERGYPTRYYLPRADVRADALVASSKHTHCPYKGDTDYFHVMIDGQQFDNAAWCYPQPRTEMTAIAHHVAFDHPRLCIHADTL